MGNLNIITFPRSTDEVFFLIINAEYSANNETINIYIILKQLDLMVTMLLK